MKASRGVLLVALALLAIAALRDFARLGDALPWRQLYDFADFYCAGEALDRHADPYTYEPLRSCEHRVNDSALFREDPRRVVPAPLPPYDLAAFAVIARAGFAPARAIDAVAILLAIAATVWALALCGIPLELAALALVLPAAYVLLNAGQVVPFALVALAFCGAALARGRDRVAGLFGALTLVEPHLGLPVCAALLLWTPRSRVPLAATGVVLAVVAALTSGLGGTVEYVWRVLPAQAAAETGYVYQYSLTSLLRVLGAPPSAALAAGDLSYLVAVGLGLWLGRRSAASLGRRELLAFLPAACSVAGGPYVHMVDVAFAIPAALVLATSLRGAPRTVAAVALCLLAVPWIPVWITKKLFLATLFVLAALLLRLRAGVPVSVTTFLSIAVAVYLFELFPPPAFAASTGVFAAGDLAQRAWGDSVARLGAAGPAWFVVKVPTWTALAALLTVASRP
jgi:hypothetical protein